MKADRPTSHNAAPALLLATLMGLLALAGTAFAQHAIEDDLAAAAGEASRAMETAVQRMQPLVQRYGYIGVAVDALLRQINPWIAGIVVIAVIAVAVYLFRGKRQRPSRGPGEMQPTRIPREYCHAAALAIEASLGLLRSKVTGSN